MSTTAGWADGRSTGEGWPRSCSLVIRGDLIVDGGGPIVSEWRSYARTVEQFYRLGATIPGDVRAGLVQSLHGYFTALRSQQWSSRLLSAREWNELQAKVSRLQDHPGVQQRRANLAVFYEKRSQFRTSYATVADTLLLVGERFVERLLELKPQV